MKRLACRWSPRPPTPSQAGEPHKKGMKSMPKQEASAAFGIVFGLLATSASGQPT